MHPPRIVLFDLDGTLIDSIDLIVDSYLHVFTTHRLPPLTRAQIVEGIGTPLWTVFGEFTSDRATIDAWIATYRAYNLAHHDTRVVAFPGVVDMVRAIASAGRRLGLVTSKNHAGALRGLELIGLRSAFEVVVGADDVTHPKPHPEPVLRALELLGGVPGEAVYIGDSHHDLACGNAAGAATIGVTWGPLPRERLLAERPAAVCETPAEVLRVVGVSGSA